VVLGRGPFLLIKFFTSIITKITTNKATTPMKYECPSCYLTWKDHKPPEEKLCFPLCAFCSQPHTQKELLNWQIDHVNDLNPQKFPKVLRHFYRFVELEIKLLKEKLYEGCGEDADD
jgi:hypothetical protein